MLSKHRGIPSKDERERVFVPVFDVFMIFYDILEISEE